MKKVAYLIAGEKATATVKKVLQFARVQTSLMKTLYIVQMSNLLNHHIL